MKFIKYFYTWTLRLKFKVVLFMGDENAISKVCIHMNLNFTFYFLMRTYNMAQWSVREHFLSGHNNYLLCIFIVQSYYIIVAKEKILVSQISSFRSFVFKKRGETHHIYNKTLWRIRRINFSWIRAKMITGRSPTREKWSERFIWEGYLLLYYYIRPADTLL